MIDDIWRERTWRIKTKAFEIRLRLLQIPIVMTKNSSKMYVLICMVLVSVAQSMDRRGEFVSRAEQVQNWPSTLRSGDVPPPRPPVRRRRVPRTTKPPLPPVDVPPPTTKPPAPPRRLPPLSRVDTSPTTTVNPCVSSGQMYKPIDCYEEFPCLGAGGLCYRIDGSDPCEKRGHECRADTDQKCPRSAPCKDSTSGMCFTVEGRIPLNILRSGVTSKNAQKHLFPGQNTPVQFHPDFEWTASVCKDLGVQESLCRVGGDVTHLYALDGRIDPKTDMYVPQKDNVDPHITRPDVTITAQAVTTSTKRLVIEGDIDEEQMQVEGVIVDDEEEEGLIVDDEEEEEVRTDILQVKKLLESASNDCTSINDFIYHEDTIQATKANMMFFVPSILTIYAKKMNAACAVSTKTFADHGIPLQLDVKQLKDDKTCRLKLVSYIRWNGVVRKRGAICTTGGHYTAGVKRNEKWYLMNDNRRADDSKGAPNLVDNRNLAVYFVYERQQCEVDASRLRPIENMHDETEPHGLPNLGNTCWFNSLMQVLSSSKLFRDTLNAIQDENVLEDYRDFVTKLKQLVNFLYDRSEVKVRDLNVLVLDILKDLKRLSSSPMDITKQQDPDEMFNKILSILHFGTGTFNRRGHTALNRNFADLATDQAAVLFKFNSRTRDRMDYEDSVHKTFMENMYRMNSTGQTTLPCQGRSTIVDKFMHLTFEAIRSGKPHGNSNRAPECLDGPGDYLSEKFVCGTSFLADL